MNDTNANTAGLPLREQLVGVLIGIARAVDGNEHLITDSTNSIVREALAAARPDANLEEGALAALIRRAEEEKRALIPLCCECAAPCGKNDNYDLRRLDTAGEEVRSLKLLLLCGICSMAAAACRAAALGHTDQEVDRFFYQVLFSIGEESFGVQELLADAVRFGAMERRCMALPGQ